MTHHPLHFAVLLLPALLPSLSRAGEATVPDVPRARQAIERSLPFLEKAGLAWLDKRKCIACHHGAFLLWSHNEARRRGFPVDEKKIDTWTDRALGLYLADLKKHQKDKNGCVEATNLLLGQAGRPAKGKTAKDLRTVAGLLANGQRKDGSWKYEGQGQKRPDHEANEATTLWAAVTLGEIDRWDPAYPRARERALSWLKENTRGKGNEIAALRLVIAVRFGTPEQAKNLAKELAARQNPDGGWNWGEGFPSDPYATGQSLYALGKAGRTGDDPVVRRAWKFLLDRQRPDGSWYAPTKKPTNKDNPIAVYWGSAWATIGLLNTLPDNPKDR
jgi:hypothetical protein